jgi:hypothetical protein
VRPTICAFLLILSIGACASRATTDDDARAFADSVLAMKDNKQYKEMYRDKFDESMKRQMTEEQWLAAAEQVDKQTGAKKTRTLSSSDKSMGVYKFRYDTQYENGRAFDDIYVTNNNGWKVVALWVRPNLQ